MVERKTTLKGRRLRDCTKIGSKNFLEKHQRSILREASGAAHLNRNCMFLLNIEPHEIQFTISVIHVSVDAELLYTFQTDFSFEVPLEEVSDLKSDSKPELIVSAEVFTSNPDINLDNNKCRIPVKLISDADISLYSSSSPNKFFVSEKISDRQLNVTHYYEVCLLILFSNVCPLSTGKK